MNTYTITGKISKKINYFCSFHIKNEKNATFYKIRGKFYSTDLSKEWPAKKLVKKLKANESSARNSGCLSVIRKHPRLVEKTLKIESQNHLTNHWSFVHGRSAAWMISQNVLESLGYQGAACLRVFKKETAFSGKEIGRIVRVANSIYCPIISEAIVKTGTYSVAILSFFVSPLYSFMDQSPNIRERLLSGTLSSLDCNFSESPFCFVLGSEKPSINSVNKYSIHLPSFELPGNQSAMENQKIKELSIDMIQIAMQAKGYAKKQIDELVTALLPVYNEAFALPIGQLLIINAPKDMLGIAFHSVPGGIPTGAPLGSKTQQIRLILTDEVLRSPRITVSDVTDFTKERQIIYDKEAVDQCMLSIYGTTTPETTEQESSALKNYAEVLNKIRGITARLK